MIHSRFKQLGFEQLEDRYLLSAVPGATHASAPAGDGQFGGQRTISYIDGSLKVNQAQAVSALQVLQDQDFHFVLTAAQWNIPSATGVQMQISDSSGQPIFSMSAPAGDTSAEEAYLDAGSYSVQFTRAAAGPVGLLRFDLGGITLPLADTTQDPAVTATKSTQSALAFYWLPLTPLPAGFLVQQPSGPSTSISLQPEDPTVDSLIRFLSGPEQGGNVADVPAFPPPGVQATPLPAAGISVGTSQTTEHQQAASDAFVKISAEGRAGDDRPAAAATDAGTTAVAPRSQPHPPHLAASAEADSLAVILSQARAAAARGPTAPTVQTAALIGVDHTAASATESSHRAEHSESWREWIDSAAQSAADFSIAPLGLALGWYTLRYRAWRRSGQPGLSLIELRKESLSR